MTKKKIMKKIITGALAIMMMASVLPMQPIIAYADTNVEAKAVETDIPNEWAIEDINFAYTYQLIAESNLKDFKSDISKEEMYEILLNLYEVKTSAKEEAKTEKIVTSAAISTKEEVKIEKSVTSAAVSVVEELSIFQKAEKLGLLTAEEVKTLKADEKATRKDVAKASYKVAKLLAPESKAKNKGPLTFADANKISVQDIDEIEYIVSNGILNGKKNNLLELESACPKQEFMVVAKRLYDLVSYENNEYSKGFLYKVKGAKNEVYVLGSIHIGDARLYPMNKELLKALSDSEYLGVEANVNEDKEGINYMVSKMVYSDGTTLKDHVSKELYDKTIAAYAQFDIPEDAAKYYKPWYSYLVLPQYQALKNPSTANLNAVAGVDTYLMSQAIKVKKPIVELEGIRFQIDMFEGFSKEIQVKLLETTIKSLEPTEKSNEKTPEIDTFDEMLTAWKDGDEKAMEKIVSSMDAAGTEDKDLKEFYEMFLNTRNEHMVVKIKEYLKQDKDYFIVVGAAHVLGDKGIVKELEKSGITVERIK